MRNLITAQEVIDLAFAENSNMMAESISDTAIRIAEIKYIRPAFGAMYPLLADKYADYTNDYVKPALAYFVKCEIVSSIAIDMSNSGVAVANPQYQSAATDKQRQRLYDSEMSKAKTLLDFALEYIATHSEEFPDFSGEAPKKHHRVGGILLGGGTSRNQSASIAGEAFKNEIEQLSKDIAEKVDKVEGKGLSTNDFTDEYKQKVDEFSGGGGGSITIDKELSPTSDNAIANSAVVNGLAGLAEGVSTAIGQVSERLGAEIETKANKDGYYPDMSVGMADNLVGRGDVQDAQINFRPSAGADNITDGAARIKKIKGNSVVWNQLVNTDSTSVELVAKRTYFTDINGEHSVRIISATTNIDVQFGRDKVSDLTKMFGVGNEPTTVEEYRQRKPMNIEDEFAYNAGTLVDMKVESLISTSDNAYDYTKGYARVMGGYKYDITANAGATLVVSFYADGEDSNEEREIAPDSEGKYTFPANGICYVNGDFAGGRDVCVCLNHTYEKPHPAYQQVVKDFSWIKGIKDDDDNLLFPNGMRSASAAPNSKWHIYDEIFFNKTIKKLTLIKRIGSTTVTKDSPIEKNINAQCAFTVNRQNLQLDGTPKTYGGCTTNNYGLDRTYAITSKGLYFNGSLLIFNLGDDSNVTTVEALKSLLETRPLQINYELAEPIVVELDYPTAETNMDYLVWDFGTEEAIATYGDDDKPIASAPFRADIQYEDNFVDDIRGNKEAIATNKTAIAKNTADIKTKQNTLTLTIKPNGNIVIGNLAGQSKEFMPATPSGDPMHDMYLTKKYVRWGKFEHNGITYGKEGYWSIWAELGGLDDITTAEMRQIWGEKRPVSLAGGAFSHTVSRTNVIDNDSSATLVYECTMPSGFRNNRNLVVANLVSANNTSVKCAPRDVNNAFNGCYKLKKILVGIDLTYCSATNNVFNGCNEIEDVLLDKLKTNISFAWSPLLSKESLLYMISNCASNATFTITLHPDVYAKCTRVDEGEGQYEGEWWIEIDDALGGAVELKNTNITLASA